MVQQHGGKQRGGDTRQAAQRQGQPVLADQLAFLVQRQGKRHRSRAQQPRQPLRFAKIGGKRGRRHGQDGDQDGRSANGRRQQKVWVTAVQGLVGVKQDQGQQQEEQRQHAHAALRAARWRRKLARRRCRS